MRHIDSVCMSDGLMFDTYCIIFSNISCQVYAGHCIYRHTLHKVIRIGMVLVKRQHDICSEEWKYFHVSKLEFKKFTKNEDKMLSEKYSKQGWWM